MNGPANHRLPPPTFYFVIFVGIKECFKIFFVILVYPELRHKQRPELSPDLVAALPDLNRYRFSRHLDTFQISSFDTNFCFFLGTQVGK